MHDPHSPHDVVIAGAGPAGLAAGLFTARYGLRTLLLDRGKSLLKQCAYLDNFLGFPGGIDVHEFLALSRAQVALAGCQLLAQRVTTVRFASEHGARFSVETSGGVTFHARNVIAATGSQADYLQGLGLAGLLDPDGELCDGALLAHGRTGVAGLYVAGVLAGVENQALISAGQAAQLALALVADERREREGLPGPLTAHLDWQIKHGSCEGPRWERRVRDHFAPLLQAAETPSPAGIWALIERWMHRKRAQQLDRPEIDRRRRRGQRLRVEISSAARAAGTTLARSP